MNYPERLGEEGKYYFQDGENKSEEYFYADEYKCGFALVKRKEKSDFQFRDINGNLSEEYLIANPYEFGMALVKKSKNSPYNFVDEYGNKSEDFFMADVYKDGYAIVKRVRGGKDLYRDVFGRVSEEKNELGDYAYKYMTGEVKKHEIPRSLFFNESFRLHILAEEVKRDKLNSNN